MAETVLLLQYNFLGAVLFNSQPSNMTVSEGSEVRFQCSFEGSASIPDWKINGTLNYWGYIAYPFMFDISDFSLTVHNVQASYDGTSFQCIIHGLAKSSIGYLTVLRHSTNDDNIVLQSLLGNSQIELISIRSTSTAYMDLHSHKYTGI